MPNWTSNKLEINGPASELTRLRLLLASGSSPDGSTRLSSDPRQLNYFDFNCFLSMPSALTDIHSGRITISGVEVELWREVSGKPVALSVEEIAALQEAHGTASWYDWANTNWGTKWNACQVISGWKELDPLEEMADVPLPGIPESNRSVTIHFNTAWAPPRPVLAKLSEMFPRLRVEHFWKNEGSPTGGLGVYEEGRLSSNAGADSEETLKALSDWHAEFVQEHRLHRLFGCIRHT